MMESCLPAGDITRPSCRYARTLIYWGWNSAAVQVKETRMNNTLTQLSVLSLLFLVGAAAGCIDVAGQSPVVDYGTVPDEPSKVVIRDLPVRIKGPNAGSVERRTFPVALAGSSEVRPQLPIRNRLPFPAGSIERVPAFIPRQPVSGSVMIQPRRVPQRAPRRFPRNTTPEAGSTVIPKNVNPFN